ncbi:MAG: metallophosphoesterase [Acidobacteria bacterium]|nr:metallophosphoesterase [Acidobacteriota bacterium]MBP7473919.1 metallophosphoesterase [Pyrinomonadaceae bacterium]MBP9109127.1 metallophosphoesterase [Pyrinomonadaceae bacterium]
MLSKRRHFLYLFPLAGVLCLVLLSYAYYIEPQRLVIRQETIETSNWDAEFDGLRIAVLSDIHGGSNYMTAERLRMVVEKTNEQNADIIVMLGDFVSQKYEGEVGKRPLKMSPADIADNLKGLRSTYGVFAVMGNHDGEFGEDKVAAEFTRVGYKVLQNEVATIQKGNKALRILGTKDHLRLTKSWKETSADIKQIVDASGEGKLIVLQHSPDVFPIVTGDLSISPDLTLFLAGHTHGGQVWFPVFGRMIVPSTFGQKYAYGHIREKNVDLFVTSGIGMSVLPLRFMVPPEIVVLTVVSK